jgi:hypothetical protein
MERRSAACVLLTGCLLVAMAHAAENEPKLPLGLQAQAAFIPDDNPSTGEKIADGPGGVPGGGERRDGTRGRQPAHAAPADRGPARTTVFAPTSDGGRGVRATVVAAGRQAGEPSGRAADRGPAGGAATGGRSDPITLTKEAQHGQGAPLR